MRKALCLALILAAPAVHATTARELSLREIVKSGDMVLTGHAVRQDSFWQGTHILTLVRVKVDEVWMGRESPGVVDVLTLGGVVGDIGQRVDGAAVLPQGPQLVLSLKRQTSGEYQAVGMAQGVWVVAQDGTTPIKVRRPYIDNLVAHHTALLPQATPLAIPVTLPSLKRAVLEAANAP